ncbi:MAG: low molecular weight phosphotyrosine protein phosphatase [Ignavibacteriaceae bacterium]|nr:low molecular weight phosphotyrosine protein phosphatase [Ignavibacteriaceae bacterium]
MKKILFVCLGNICRSPAAEGILKKYINESGLENEYQIDSAGLLDYHEGETYDPRMIKHAQKRGYDLPGTSRPFVFSDFEKYDLIIALDNEIFNSLKALDKKNKYSTKIVKMIDFYSNKKFDGVPDPYYSGASGFELVLDILEDSCQGLLKKLSSDDSTKHQK